MANAFLETNDIVRLPWVSDRGNVTEIPFTVPHLQGHISYKGSQPILPFKCHGDLFKECTGVVRIQSGPLR
jgi:hypothetical protein